KNDCFILTSDGVHEFVAPNTFKEHIDKPVADFEYAAQTICNTALSHNSSDNVSCLIVQVSHLPKPSLIEFHEKLAKRA
ncbi:bifunctional protein-serine/threonine kinase/phosphatase, partial [Vibrio sp. 10N.261.49.A5]